MHEEMTKDRFIEVMRSERERWEALLADIGRGEWDSPPVPGKWSARDIAAHVTAYERGLVDWLEAARQGTALTFADLDHPDVDYRNAMIVKESQSKSLEEVRAEANRVFRRLMALVEDTPEQALLDARAVEWYVKPRWGKLRALWQCIADDSYRHYRQH
jgi:hypothetical protein